MKIQLAFIVALMALGVADPGAQYRTRLPPGSYSRTCRDAALIGSVLTAQCRDQNGITIRSRLYVGNCFGDIINQLGELVCGGRSLPRGTFHQTCTACTADGSALQCACRDTKGASITTTLDLASCDWGGDITNKDGHLQCEEARGAGR
jgi:hypothetical protein